MSKTKNPEAPEKSADVEVRLLLDCTHGKVNQIVSLGAAEAERALSEGWGDPSPAAVAAAR